MLAEFKDRVESQLLPQFCLERGLDCEGFRTNWHGICETDAADFLRGLDHQLVIHEERGLYRAARSRAREQFFWTGRKGKVPRPITLWIEPIITVAVLARLRFAMRWPSENLGTQSPKWGFDVCAYSSPVSGLVEREPQLVIACEVKKSKSELDGLISLMKEFGRRDVSERDLLRSREKNAYRKLGELRELKPIFFWAVGPDCYNFPFRIVYRESGRVEFSEVPLPDLTFGASQSSERVED